VAERGEKLLCDIVSILDLEKPDLVVFTGDNMLSTPGHEDEYWRKLTAPIAARHISWIAVMGNHDAERGRKNNRDMMSLIASLPFGDLSARGPEELGGGGNFILTVASARGNKPAAALYALDSGAQAPKKMGGGYAWFSFKQIAWLREQTLLMTAANGGKPLPSLAFIHIPIPEYDNAWKSGIAFGSKNEAIFCADINSGIFAAIVETGGIMGVFAGHAHNNDYAAVFKGVCLAFGRKTGEFSYHKLPSGGRVIELYEGRREFSTWIRTGAGAEEYRCDFPGAFQQTAEGAQTSKTRPRNAGSLADDLKLK
jgi:hypothetical protein